jgi:hypothetical protein
MLEKTLLKLGWTRKKPVIRKSTKHPGFWECSYLGGMGVIGKNPDEAYRCWYYLFGPNRI